MFARLSFAKASKVAQRHAKIANEMGTGKFADVQPFQLPASFSTPVSRRCGYFLQREPLYQSYRSLNASLQYSIYGKYRIYEEIRFLVDYLLTIA